MNGSVTIVGDGVLRGVVSMTHVDGAGHNKDTAKSFQHGRTFNRSAVLLLNITLT